MRSGTTILSGGEARAGREKRQRLRWRPGSSSKEKGSTTKRKKRRKCNRDVLFLLLPRYETALASTVPLRERREPLRKQAPGARRNRPRSFAASQRAWKRQTPFFPPRWCVDFFFCGHRQWRTRFTSAPQRRRGGKRKAKEEEKKENKASLCLPVCAACLSISLSGSACPAHARGA